MKHLVLINGRSTSGKDTFVQEVDSYFATLDPYREDSKRWMVYNLSSVQPIKDIVSTLGLGDPEKGPEWRELIVDIKLALNKVRRSADKLALQSVKEAFGSNHETYNAVVFLHVREPESIQQFIATAPFTWKVSTMWIEREDVPVQANDSTKEDWPYDFVISNSSSLQDFKAQAIEFAQKFQK